MSAKKYCYCRGPDHGGFMILCDACGLWCHGECMDITKKQAEKIANWYCHLCCRSMKIEETVLARCKEEMSKELQAFKNSMAAIGSKSNENEDNAASQAIIDELKKNNNEMQSVIDKLKDKLEQELQAFKNSIAAIGSKSNENEDNAASQAIIDELKKNNNEMQSVIDKLKDKLEQVQTEKCEEIERLHRKNQAMIEELHNKNEKLQEMETVLREKQVLLENLQKEKEELKFNFEERGRKIESIRKRSRLSLSQPKF